VYGEFVVADAHCDTALRALDGHDLRAGDRVCHVDLPKMKAGGVDLQVFALWVDNHCLPMRPGDRLSIMMARLASFLEDAAAEIGLVSDYSGFEKQLSEGKISALLAVEGAHSLPAETASIDLCHQVGVRLITLCWNNTNWLASSSRQAKRFPFGLTPLGRKAVKRMTELGVIVDVSHASERAFWDVAEICRNPFVASHSCAKALCDHHRNLDDEQLRAIAFVKGVVGVNFHWQFLKEEAQASIEDVVSHIDYIISKIGDDHVCLGSDFDGIPSGPKGLEDISRIPRLIDALLAKGYSEDTVKKVAGENFLRVFKEVCG